VQNYSAAEIVIYFFRLMYIFEKQIIAKMAKCYRNKTDIKSLMKLYTF